MNDGDMKKPIKGRPVGSTDVSPRKKRSDKELIVAPGDNSKITLHNLKLMNQPRIDANDREQVENRILWYFETCLEDDIKPGVAGLCVALGISRQAWQTWGAGTRRNYTDIVERTRQVMESIMEQYMLSGKINPVTGIFLLKNNFGYADKSEVVLTPNSTPLGERQDVEALKQKYLENTYGISDDDAEQSLPGKENFEGGMNNE